MCEGVMCYQVSCDHSMAFAFSLRVTYRPIAADAVFENCNTVMMEVTSLRTDIDYTRSNVLLGAGVKVSLSTEISVWASICIYLHRVSVFVS